MSLSSCVCGVGDGMLCACTVCVCMCVCMYVCTGVCVCVCWRSSLTCVFGQSWSNADLQHLVGGLEHGLVPLLAGEELHLARPPRAPRPPGLLLQLQLHPTARGAWGTHTHHIIFNTHTHTLYSTF